jgi:hypothetical protein
MGCSASASAVGVDQAYTGGATGRAGTIDCSASSAHEEEDERYSDHAKEFTRSRMVEI